MRNSFLIRHLTIYKAKDFEIETFAFFGFPKDRCATIMLATTIDYLEGSTSLERVFYCLYDRKTLKIFGQTLELLISKH